MDTDTLSSRRAWLERRQRHQRALASRHRERFFSDARFASSVTFILKAFGVYNWGYRNHLAIEVVHRRVYLPRLPRAFDGYKILHLSDTHIDLDPRRALTPAIIDAVTPLSYDLCVFTGDFVNEIGGEPTACMTETAKLMEHIHGPAVGILGNHDTVEMAPKLESLGIKMLLDEVMTLERAGERLYLAGCDVPFGNDRPDIAALGRQIPRECFSILLSHYPTLYTEAAAAGFDLMLSGHTHAGQICLPWGYIPYKNEVCPLPMLGGPWEHAGMRGYTGRGTGCCAVPVRFFCPPEITVHELTCS